MGRSKKTLFLDRTLEAARGAFDEVIAVDRPDGVPIDGLRTIFEPEHEGRAPIFGVVRALHDAGDRAFILAVDYPLVTTDVLSYLRDQRRIPVWDGHPQLLCSVWEGELLPLLEERIARSSFDLRGLPGQEMIPESELRARFGGEPLMNVNTPEELGKVERMHGR